MGEFTREELERAFAAYARLRDEATRTGDWSVWAEQFTDDAHYVEHAYGELHGREAIRTWITGVMAPFPNMRFTVDWQVIDPDRGWVVFQCQNAFPPPEGTPPEGTPEDPAARSFAFPTWSRIRYAGEGRWSEHEDMYNPREGGEALSAWRKAGGRFQAPERVKMRE